MAGWHTPFSARAFWKDAAALSDETVSTYLVAARSACLAFAPLPEVTPAPTTQLVGIFENGQLVGTDIRFSADVAPDFTGELALPIDEGVSLVVEFADGAPVGQSYAEVIPEEYRLAQVMQARNIHNAVKNGAGQQIDPSTGYVSPAAVPLDWNVRQLLNPVKAFGGIA